MQETPTVVIYATGLCGYCAAAKRLLMKKSVEFTEIRIDKEAGMRAEMVQRSGRTSVPQIFIGSTHVGGFDDLSELEAEGTLDDLLGMKPTVDE